MEHTIEPGWSVGESIALELETMLYVMTNPMALRLLDPMVKAFIDSIPADWLNQWQALALPRIIRLDHAAHLAGMLTSNDYMATTLAIRELDFAGVLVRLRAYAQQRQIDVPPQADAQRQVLEIYHQLVLELHQYANIAPFEQEEAAARSRKSSETLASILPGGTRFARFWFLLDRFFYDLYQPWRETRLGLLAAQRERALEHLGQSQGHGTPSLDWLPVENPVRIPELKRVLELFHMPLYFWVEPFGLFDFVFVVPYLMVTPFSVADSVITNYRLFVEQLSSRLHALSDPTRLMLLRTVRHLELNNADLADMLGVSRPTISVHARILREAGLISTRSEGRQVRHFVQIQEIRRLYDELRQLLDIDNDT